MSSPSVRHCHECGAALQSGAQRCWLCGASVAEEPLDAIVLPPVAGQTTNTATFSLSSLFLVMTLIAVGAGVAAAAPGLGIVFAIIATPALLRTIVVTSRQKARGAVRTPGEKIVAFLGSVGVVLLVLLSIGVALFTACLTACASFAMFQSAGEKAIIAGAVVGGVPALGVMIWVLWLLLHHRRKV